MEKGGRWYQYAAAASANLGILSVGMCMVWPSPIIPKLVDVNTSPLESAITKSQESWIGSLITLGAAVGPLYNGLFAKQIGRKYAILSSGIPLIIGWILMAAAKNIIQIYVARVIWGLAMGQLFTLIPMYVAEISDKEVRGALGSFLQIFLVSGIFLTFSIGPYVSYVTFNLIGLVPPIMFVIAFSFMPGSPNDLLLKGNHDAAVSALIKLRRKSEGGVQEEFDNLKESLNQNKEQSKISDLWTIRGNFKALYLSFGLVAFQQLSGANAVLIYLQPIFGQTGTDMTEDISSIIIGAVQIFVSSLNIYLADKWGRRILLVMSSLGMFIGMFLLGIYFYLKEIENPAVNSLKWLPVTSLMIFVCAFCLGYGTLTWAVIGELFDPQIKGIGSAIVNVFCWVVGFFVTKLFQSSVETIGFYYTYWIFGGISFIGFFFGFFLLPETKMKTLQEIQDILNNRPKATEMQNFSINND